jgi:hypothetical protein
LLWISCETEPDDEGLIIDSPIEEGNFETVGVYEMNYGPTDLAVKNQHAFVCRDDKIYVLYISDVTNPILATTIDDVENNNDFERLLIHENILYAAYSSTSGVYVIDRLLKI